MKTIRKATTKDVSRIAEMIVFNYRINFYPFFNNDTFYFSELNVINMASDFNEDILQNTYVYDDGVIKGMIHVNGDELVKLYVEPQFQSYGIGTKLLKYAVDKLKIIWLWALEYNKRGIEFYKRNGFHLTGERIIEDERVPLLKLSLSCNITLKKIGKDSPDKPTLDKINTNSFNKEQITSIGGIILREVNFR